MRRGDVRAVILDMLGDRPMHGYELIREVEQRSGGRWRPSPGSVYPTLQLLEDEGLVTAAEQDGRRVFSLTEAGRAAHDERAAAGRAGGAGEPWPSADDPRFQLRDAVFGLHEATMQVGRTGSPAQVQRALDVLTQARRSLYRILAEDETGA
jgi:DNA-binding PadR family transcriptional regulator